MQHPINQMMAKAIQDFQTQNFDAAEAALSQILKMQPKIFDALHILGVIKGIKNRHQEALDYFRQALKIDPNHSYLNFNIAKAFSEIGQDDRALKYHLNAIKMDPNAPERWLNYGKSLSNLNKADEALTAYQKAIELNPDYAEAWINLGCAQINLKTFPQALNSFDRALKINSEFAEAWSNRGNALRELKEYAEAVASYDKAIALNPDHAEAYNDRGVALQALKQLEEALASYDKAIVLKPNYAEAWYSRGVTLGELGRFEEALVSYDKAISIKPDYVEAWSNRGNILFAICHFELGEASCRRAMSIAPQSLVAHDSLLLNLNYLDTLNHQDTLELAKNFGAKVSETSIPKFTCWNTSEGTKKLRVGFVSGDFRNHSVGYFVEGLIANIDKTQFEIYAFPTTSSTDDLTNRLLPLCAEWVPIHGMSDADAASVIHQKGIHILFDLSGHTAHNRLAMFSHKPAPVQVSWLGLPMTTGVPEIDYVLGDAYALPEQFENQFTETVWRLPESYLCLTTPHDSIEVGTLPALANGYVTFASFNNLSKMNNKVVEVWSLILKALPNSKLLLKAKQLSDPNVCVQTKKRFAAFGVDADRILLKTVVNTRIEHLASYNAVDIALDTFPFPGVTTSVEANWMGIPVLALKGHSFLSSTATSIANNAGLDDWVASDVGDYVDKAIQFASDLHRLASLRSSLRNLALKSSLYDSPRFAKNFGDALWGMWRQHSQKKGNLIGE